ACWAAAPAGETGSSPGRSIGARQPAEYAPNVSATAPAVSVRGLGKTYRIGRAGHRPTTVVEAVGARLRSPWARSRFTEFDALTDVDLDVPWGEALGIVGRNGAGKSTLLKLLTRVTAPTRGRIELAGRMGSLLEVG